MNGDGDAEGPADGDGRVLGVPPDGVAVAREVAVSNKDAIHVVEAATHDAISAVAQVERVAELVQRCAQGRGQAAAVGAPVITVVHQLLRVDGRVVKEAGQDLRIVKVTRCLQVRPHKEVSK